MKKYFNINYSMVFILVLISFLNIFNQVKAQVNEDIPSCESITPMDEYICNGTFDIAVLNVSNPSSPHSQVFCASWGVNATVGSVGDTVLNTCNFRGTPDVIHANTTSGYSSTSAPAPLDTNFPYLRNARAEAMVMKLKQPLVSGQSYNLSFDYALKNTIINSSIDVALVTGTPIATGPSSNQGALLSNPHQVVYQETSSNEEPNIWHHVSEIFIADGSYESIVFQQPNTFCGTASHCWTLYDNISITPVTPVAVCSFVFNTNLPIYTTLTNGTVIQTINNTIDINTIGSNGILPSSVNAGFFIQKPTPGILDIQPINNYNYSAQDIQSMLSGVNVTNINQYSGNHFWVEYECQEEVIFSSTCYIPGDVNSDGVVDSIDQSLLMGYYNTGDMQGDLNDDGLVSVQDIMILIANYGLNCDNFPDPITNIISKPSPFTGVGTIFTKPTKLSATNTLYNFVINVMPQTTTKFPVNIAFNFAAVDSLHLFDIYSNNSTVKITRQGHTTIKDLLPKTETLLYVNMKGSTDFCKKASLDMIVYTIMQEYGICK